LLLLSNKECLELCDFDFDTYLECDLSLLCDEFLEFFDTETEE